MSDEEVRLRLAEGVEETVSVTSLGDNHYRLEETPVSSFLNDEVRVFYGDVIQAAPAPDGALRFQVVVARSGLNVFDWILPRDIVESSELATYLAAVMEAGGNWERFFGGCLLVHLPRDTDFDPEATLQQAIARVRAPAAGTEEGYGDVCP